MPQDEHRSKAKPISPEFIRQVHDLSAQGIGLQRMAKQLGVSYRLVLRAYHEPTNGDSPESETLPAVPAPSVPSAQWTLPSAEQWASHETRLQVLEHFVATIQAQLAQPPVQPITVQPSAGSVYALPSAEPVQPFDDPEEAEPERWNLWLPRGLKRRIEAYAKAAGVAPSQLVQRLLMAALPRVEVPHD